jgi:hypothetical protein
VLIGLAVSLALIFLLIAAGMLLGILRRRRQGYVPAPSPASAGGLGPAAVAGAPDAGENVRRIPPEELLGGLTAGRAGGRGWASQKVE